MYKILFQEKEDDYQVESLMDREFGPMRHEKLAYRFRDQIEALEGLSFVIKKDKELVASLRFWPAMMSCATGFDETVLLGPIAVSADHGGQGLGQDLIMHGIEAAKRLGFKSVVLVGDEAYYEKMGFSHAAAAHLYIDGFNDYGRLLGLEFEKGHLSADEWLLEPAVNFAKLKAA